MTVRDFSDAKKQELIGLVDINQLDTADWWSQVAGTALINPTYPGHWGFRMCSKAATKAAAAALALALLAPLLACDTERTDSMAVEQQDIPPQDAVPGYEPPSPEEVAIMKENRELLKEELAKVDIRDDLREQQLDILITTLWQFRDPKVGHPIGRIRDLSITVDEEETTANPWDCNIYLVTFADERGSEYSGSIDGFGGVGYFTQIQYDPETGMPIIGHADPPFAPDPGPLE